MTKIEREVVKVTNTLTMLSRDAERRSETKHDYCAGVARGYAMAVEHIMLLLEIGKFSE